MEHPGYVVQESNGTLGVIEGQHRWQAAKDVGLKFGYFHELHPKTPDAILLMFGATNEAATVAAECTWADYVYRWRQLVQQYRSERATMIEKADKALQNQKTPPVEKALWKQVKEKYAGMKKYARAVCGYTDSKADDFVILSIVHNEAMDWLAYVRTSLIPSVLTCCVSPGNTSHFL